MVVIPLVSKTVPGQTTPEWVMVELQGELLLDGGTMAGQHVGELQITGESAEGQRPADNSGILAEKKAVFVIGTYALTGDVIPLRKPMAVLRKNKQVDANGNIISVLEIQAIVRKKVIFKERPRHIIIAQT